MTLKRTTVYVDEQDLAIIKEAAARRGVPEAEIIRRGVHLAAMGERRWEEPLEMPAFDSGDPTFANRVREVLHGDDSADHAA
ncbi:CopG family transcriptional regulator [Streptomyces sp. NPDC057617]|uniref:ribbon-helix-helix domain-containing protein n=1 Tax=Streptomyces sp. NPDC057617 TaxID=3346184 RepID=UPI003690412A